MKDGKKEKFTNCKKCGSKCNHDDDGFDMCRFCLADSKTSKDSKNMPIAREQ